MKDSPFLLQCPMVSRHGRQSVAMKVRIMEKQLIVSNPNVMMGKPVIAGTRITVELILVFSAFAASAGDARSTLRGAYCVYRRSKANRGLRWKP